MYHGCYVHADIGTSKWFQGFQIGTDQSDASCVYVCIYIFLNYLTYHSNSLKAGNIFFCPVDVFNFVVLCLQYINLS